MGYLLMKKAILFFLVLLLPLAFSSCLGIIGTGTYESKANSYCEKGEYDKAIEYYDKALDKNNKKASVYCGKALALKSLGKHKEAIECCDKALSLDSGSADAYNTKGSALIALSKNEEALKSYKKALELDPENPTFLSNVSFALNALDKYDEALEYGEKAVKENPALISAYINTGNALEGLGETEEAIKAYDKAIKYGPRESKAYVKKGCALQVLYRDKEAIENFDKALKIDPKYHEAFYYKAESLIYIGNYEEAVKCMDKSIGMSNDNPEYYLGKGRALYFSGKYKESMECIEKSLKLDPESSNTLLWKARNHLCLKEYDKADEICDAVLRKEPDNPFAYDVKGSMLVARNQYKESIPMFDKAIELDPGYEDAYSDKVGACYYMKSYSRCISIALETLKKYPRNVDVLCYLADCYSVKNMHNEAIEYYKKVIESNPDGDRFYSLVAYEYFILQDFFNAEIYSKKALDLNKDNKTAAGVQNAVDNRKLPESRQISQFISENYLYYEKVRDFENKSKAFNDKKDVSIGDITSFVNSVKVKNDIFTFVVSGKDYDAMMEMEKADQLVFKELDKDVVFVGINSFTSNTGCEFKEIIEKIKNPQNKYLVIDLRDNGGGLASQSNDVLDLLLPACTTSYLIYRDGYMDSYYSDDYCTKFKGIYIFTNQNSASSAELLTLGLKKFLPDVTVVGSPTLGKGVGQCVYENKAKKYKIYLVSFYWNVKEKNISGEKIKPDIKVWGNNINSFLNAVYKDIAKK